VSFRIVYSRNDKLNNFFNKKNASNKLKSIRAKIKTNIMPTSFFAEFYICFDLDHSINKKFIYLDISVYLL